MKNLGLSLALLSSCIPQANADTIPGKHEQCVVLPSTDVSAKKIDEVVSTTKKALAESNSEEEFPFELGKGIHGIATSLEFFSPESEISQRGDKKGFWDVDVVEVTPTDNGKEILKTVRRGNKELDYVISTSLSTGAFTSVCVSFYDEEDYCRYYNEACPQK